VPVPAKEKALSIIDVQNAGRRWIGGALLLLAIVIAPLAVRAEEDPSAATEAESLKNTIILWSRSLESFSGSYRLWQENLMNTAPAQDDIKRLGRLLHPDRYPDHFEWRVIIRTTGRNAYFELHELNTVSPTNPDPDVEIYSYYNGVYDSFSRTKGYPICVANDHSRNGLPFPWGGYITPEEIFGRQREFLLGEVLSSGNSRVVERDGLKILSHVKLPVLRTGAQDPLKPEDVVVFQKCVDVAVDADGHVARIEWVSRPYPSEETVRQMWPGDPFDLRTKGETLELGDYAEIDGVAFPRQVVKTWWTKNKSDIDAASARYAAGEISQDELRIDVISLPAIERCVQTFTLEKARLNVPLTEADFKIDWPKGVKVWDAKEVPPPGAIVGEPCSPYYYPAIVGGVLGILAIIGVVACLIIRRRRR